MEQLAEKSGHSHVWVKKQLDAAATLEQKLVPQPTPLAADMTFWGRGYGACVFRSPTMKENLWWTESEFETPRVYRTGLEKLQADGWVITGAVIDGKRGVAQVFEAKGIPVQYCQFHQQKTVTKYLTRRPKTDAARELRALTLTLARTSEESFSKALTEWHTRWKSFLEEQSPALHKKRRWDWTHRRIRAAHRSLKSNLGRLFTYQNTLTDTYRTRRTP